MPDIVRNGVERRLTDDEGGHTVLNVYGEMLQHCMYHYKMLPDPRSLNIDEICWLYDFIRKVLIEETKPRPK